MKAAVSFPQTLVNALDIQPGEERMVGLLLLFSFCNGLVRTFTRSATYGMFLAVFSAQMLPYVYIGVSLVASLTSFAYLKISQRAPLSRLLVGTLAAIILVLGLLRLGIGAGAGAWLIFTLPICYEVLLVMTNLALWNTAGRLCNVQQGKRLFGLISTGEPTAAVVGGFLTAPIVALIGTSNLLLLSAGTVALTLLIASRLIRTNTRQLTHAVEQHTSNARTGPAALLKNRYVLLIFSLYTLAIISYYFIDNIFYAQAQLQYTDANQLASFIGVFYALVGIVWTLTNAFVIGALFRRYGLRAGLIVAPAALGLSALAIVVAGSMGAALVLVFWLAALGKLLSRLSFDGLVKMSLNIIYQPLAAAQRVPTQTLNEGIIYAGAIGATGLLLSALTNLLQLSSIQLAGVLVAVTIGWLAVAMLLLREYIRQLVHALAQRSLGSSDLAFVEPETSAILQRALGDPHPDVALYAMRTLGANDNGMLPDRLPKLLQHPAASVRQAALGEIERRELTDVRATIAPLLLQEPDPAVRGAAARVLATLQGSAILEELAPYLVDAEPLVRQGVTVGLLRGGGIAGILAAGQQLLQWASSDDPAERALAARTLGEVGIANFDQPLADLLGDADRQVRRAALAAAGQIASPRLWPLAVAALADRTTAEAASTALAAAGEAALPALSQAFPASDRQVQMRIAQVCGRIGGPAASELLLFWCDQRNPAVRTEVLRALARSGYHAEGELRRRIQQLVRDEAGSGAGLLAALVDCGESCGALLLRALEVEIGAVRERILSLLCLIADPLAIGRARLALASDSAEQRAYALEVIDTQLPQELKTWVLPLIGELAPAQKLQRLGASLPQHALGRNARLTQMIATSDDQLTTWTRACAIHTAGELRIAELADAVLAAQESPEPLLRETAIWAAARLPNQGSSKTLHEGIGAMLSRIEKLLILKTVGIFLETPDDVLADVAGLLDETAAPAGTTIFHKGETGTSMYIIVDGEVRVHDGMHTLNQLHARDVFGEMALLDPEPRSASITAVADTLLLRLDQAPFYELMDEHNQIARGIIRMLTRHLRARVRDLAEARLHVATPAEPAAATLVQVS